MKKKNNHTKKTLRPCQLGNKNQQTQHFQINTLFTVIYSFISASRLVTSYSAKSSTGFYPGIHFLSGFMIWQLLAHGKSIFASL